MVKLMASQHAPVIPLKKNSCIGWTVTTFVMGLLLLLLCSVLLDPNPHVSQLVLQPVGLDWDDGVGVILVPKFRDSAGLDVVKGQRSCIVVVGN